MNPATINTAAERRPTLRDRARRILFPYAVIPWPDVEGARDGLSSTTAATLSWMDRFRVLISGRLEIRTITPTENPVGWHKTFSQFNALPPKWLESGNAHPRISLPVASVSPDGGEKKQFRRAATGFVHLAGPMVREVQLCVRCGAAIIDDRNAMRPVGSAPTRGFPEGAVAVEGEGRAYCSTAGEADLPECWPRR